MVKFSIEYKRTVRLAPYETLTIGMRQEFDTADFHAQEAMNTVKNHVEFMLGKERARLAPGE